MRKQRNMTQMKQQEKKIEKNINELEINNMPDK